ncbi:helix-turn-helix domain-containing protein [Pseudactinotalea sp. Z1739]|uniref:helix-turn-helix domain-containing protein n=1 Tax=Pseudactinotalea sp. Z1739 TaxID=3413028 RepID=UPI003C7BCD69
MTTLIEQVAARQRHTISPALARAIRQGAGVTQAEIAAELGVHPFTVYRWERGTRRPGHGTQEAYTRLLRQLQELT